MHPGTVLIVDDNKSVLTSLELLLEDEFERVETASNPNRILSLLEKIQAALQSKRVQTSAQLPPRTGTCRRWWPSRSSAKTSITASTPSR